MSTRKTQRVMVTMVRNGFVAYRDGAEGEQWVATDLDGLLDVLHTLFEPGEGPRGFEAGVAAGGDVDPSPDEEAAGAPQAISAYSAGEGGEPSYSPPAPDADATEGAGSVSASEPPPGGDQEEQMAADLAQYPRVTKAPTGKFSMMCPEHGAHTAVIRSEKLQCTGRTGGVWCDVTVPMPVVRLMLGEAS